MAYQLQNLNGTAIDAAGLRRQVDDLLQSQSQRYRRLWLYYRNPMLPRSVDRDEQGSDRPYRQAQEWGLPSRITGCRASVDPFTGQAVDGVARKEVVVENDIAWRIDTMVDFLFGKPFTICSTITDPQRCSQIESLIKQVFEKNGGMLLFQQMALLGAIYGFIDVLVKFDPPSDLTNEPAMDGASPSTGNDAENVGDDSLPPQAESAPRQDDSADRRTGTHPLSDALLPRIAQAIRLEIVEPARALPLLSQTDWTDVAAYVQVYKIRKSPQTSQRAIGKPNWLSRVFSQLTNVRSAADENFSIVTEILTPTAWQRYEDESLIAQGGNSLGQIPLVHIQNVAVPFQYAGNSDVESLIPLQDELNTRLSDRANRITMQSFKMYLGKGIENFTNLPVAPGRMWVTDNDNADVIEFGGEAENPSEDHHIQELREAMDKSSSVTPIAAGAIRGRIGNLTSAAALRVTMMSLLAKTERKRTTYGQAICRMCELAMAWLDQAGLFPSSAEERKFTINWPGILPDSQMEQLREAQAKLSLGIPQIVVLKELGYDVSLEAAETE
jgi:hypothetical protein